MAREISLSIEETNKLRAQVGLKLIPIDDGKKKETRDYISISNNKQRETLPQKKYQFVDENVLNKLQRRVRNRSSILQSTESSEETDWLSQVKHNKPKPANRIAINFENEGEQEDEDLLPIVQVSKDLGQLKSDKDVILTLKDQEVSAPDNASDILEDTNEIEKDLNGRALSRRHEAKKSSLNIKGSDTDQGKAQTSSTNMLSIGAINSFSSSNKTLDNGIKSTNATNMIKVQFIEPNIEDVDDSSDFKKPKIKKRKRKQETNNSFREKQNTIKRNVQLSSINLDTDVLDTEEDEFVVLPNISSSRKKQRTAEDIAEEIEREEQDRRKRQEEIERLKSQKENTLTLSETADFFDNLQANLLKNPQVSEDISDINNDNKKSDDVFNKAVIEQNQTEIIPQTEDITSLEENANNADFYSGIASTLHFLKDNNALVKKEEPSKKDKEVSLEYKDTEGNILTTKEAYKLLSQKFHGTKSNKKKQEKFKAKVRARNQKEEPTSYANLDV
ncbi:hypothetical protein RNJ44_02604 [Nakaseomyces bracarensis]|uniref:Uncharacterized protein n=1 Tax=Nakaseomyces bracarensis TaxID=273131 RepID=A0ABR4NZW3_9SACH